MIAWLIPGGAWTTAHFEAAGKALAGRLNRRQRRKLLKTVATMLGAAGVTALVETSGLVPAGVLGPAVSAVLAGAFSVWPRLHLEAAILARVAWAAVTTMLAWTGSLVVAAVFLWDERDPASAWTLGETVKHLRADAPTILSCLFTAWTMFCVLRFGIVGGTRSGAIRHAALAREGVARSDRELTARHEAAHALVACVLGMPMESAWINDAASRNRLGIGGAVSIGVPPVALTPEASYGLLARKIAVFVAGVVGERGPRPMKEIMWGLQTQRDWAQAKELSWFAASLQPGQVLVETVLEAVVPALHTGLWTAAIEEGAQALLRAGSGPVPPDVFAAIARRFGLALPAVETLAAAFPNPPTQEITA